MVDIGEYPPPARSEAFYQTVERIKLTIAIAVFFSVPSLLKILVIISHFFLYLRVFPICPPVD